MNRGGNPTTHSGVRTLDMPSSTWNDSIVGIVLLGVELHGSMYESTTLSRRWVGWGWLNTIRNVGWVLDAELRQVMISRAMIVMTVIGLYGGMGILCVNMRVLLPDPQINKKK